MAILLPRNDVLNVHPAPQGQHLSVHGSDWLWAATALFAFNTVSLISQDLPDHVPVLTCFSKIARPICSQI